ncbi:MAG TPA: hypothetical protein VMO24_07220 [Woeseiaceae bacterium]|nr:hypothetical protein [Woeseiaceae bacterium]
MCCLLLGAGVATAHGSVAAEDDLCIIEIGYYKAHFKIYLPHERRHREYCEDLPSSGESVFVMEYVHAGLGEVPIDFRIIRNVTGQGRFTRLHDIEQIPDLEEITVFHHRAATQPDVFTVLHEFESAGKFVGIVTATQPDDQKVYTAVFPFDVGFTGFGYWPLFAVIAIALQLNYLRMSGWFSRYRQRKRPQLRVEPGTGQELHG